MFSGGVNNLAAYQSNLLGQSKQNLKLYFGMIFDFPLLALS